MDGLDWQTGEFPLGKTVLQAAGLEAVPPRPYTGA